MTNREAIEFLNTPEEVRMTTELFEFTQVCKEALEKQIPKKPNDYNDGFLYCESCGHPTLNKDKSEPYCFICGQAIDWSDNE